MNEQTHLKTIDDIWQFIEQDKIQLDQYISQSAQSAIDLSNQVSNYIISSGGKRIRPLVLLLLAKNLGYQGELHYPLATAVEFIHTATLLHDDVVDESALRRNRPTVNHQFGNAAAVLVGDFLYTRAFQLISQELEAAKIMSNATNELAMGEVMQLMNINNLDLTEADYFQVIHLKTAVLFSAACQFAAVLAKHQEVSRQCADYGKYLGSAFQIADDVLDYVGDSQKTGKSLGDDLAESKMTLPLIHAMNHANPTDTAHLRETIAKGNREAIDDVLTILEKNKSILYAQNIAYEHANLAKAAITALPDNQYKQILLHIPDMAVRRHH